MSVWRSDVEMLQSVFAEILSADRELFVLVNSQQRSGSKYLQGVLASAFGLRSGLSPEFVGPEMHGLFRRSYPVNPGHTHGLSDQRLSELTHMLEKRKDPTGREQKDQAKAGMLLRYRERISRTAKVIVFTVIRDDDDRLISSFVLQKSGGLEGVSDADIEAEYVRFRRGKTFDDWVRTEMTGVFGVPPVTKENSAPLILQDGKMRFVVVPIDCLDAFLTKHLFSVATVTELADRSWNFGLRYGLGQRNSSRNRGLEEVTRRVRTALNRE